MANALKHAIRSISVSEVQQALSQLRDAGFSMAQVSS